MITIQSLANDLRLYFPADPVPPYPSMMGMNPVGIDEYSLFANRRWTEVPPVSYFQDYDISPANGFSSIESPHLWNYHLPGFLLASLLHENACEKLDSFMYFFNRAEPKLSQSSTYKVAWWESETFSGGFNLKQCETIVSFLQFLRHSGGGPPLYYDWDELDCATLENWHHRMASLT